jgi:hypothetical protein
MFDLLIAHPGPRAGTQQQDGHIGVRDAELLESHYLVLAAQYQGHLGSAAWRHCISCQCARIFRSRSSGVEPVSTAPALPIADQSPSSTPKAC